MLVDLLQDTVFRIHPLTDVDAAEMLQSLKAAALLHGYRGHPPADEAAAIDVLLRISALLEICPEIHELDINPLKVLERGARAVDVELGLSPAIAENTTLEIAGPEWTETLQVPQSGLRVRRSLTVPAGRSEVRFMFRGTVAKVVGDPRPLAFRIDGMKMHVLPGKSGTAPAACPDGSSQCWSTTVLSVN